jgi:hypothetical protein
MIFAGFMVATRILARVPREIDLCARALGSQCPLLRHKLLDLGDCGVGYCPSTLQCFHQADLRATRSSKSYISSFLLLLISKSDYSFHPSSASSNTPSLSACVETQFSNICVPAELPPADFLTPLRLTIKHKIRP